MTAGIVCEYNPFHNGHLYQIKKTKETGADFIVCVMSGNFVQRGECAFFDKWIRAKCAVMCGADVVIDLPLPWALGSAESFARGSIGLLADFGIDTLSFGSEFDEANLLKRCAEISEDKKVGERIRSLVSSGLSYPSALTEAVKEQYSEKEAAVFSSPNSTLAIEYIRALGKFSPDTELMPILRIGAGHDSEKTLENIASASKIRGSESFKKMKDYIPEEIFSLLFEETEKGFAPCKTQNAERAILSSLREMKKEEYERYVTDETGLAQRIYENVKSAGSLNELYDLVKSKNFTHSRIRREVMSLYLKIDKDIAKEKAPYMKILAASKRGLSLLSSAKSNSSVPIITRHSETASFTGRAKEVYSLQCESTDKFALFSQKVRPCSLEQKNSIIIL